MSKRVLVVGGNWHNIPNWARDAFDIEHVDQDQRNGVLQPKAKADCVVVQVNWTSHNMSGQAHELGRKWEVPVLKARDGWSSAVAHAARNKIDWFVDAVQLAGNRRAKEAPEEAAEVEEIVNNAWRAHAMHEREKAEAAESRLRKVQAKLDKTSEAYERLRSGAEERVIQAITQRAKELREVMSEERAQLQDELDEVAREAAQFAARIKRLENVLRNGVDSDDSHRD